MFKSLFHSGRVLARHINRPLAEERTTFLTHLALVGISRSTLLRHARQLWVIAILLDKQVPGHVTLELIGQCAQRWARRQRQRGRVHCLKWSAKYFVQVACAWCASWSGSKKSPAPRRRMWNNSRLGLRFCAPKTVWLKKPVPITVGGPMVSCAGSKDRK